MGLFSRLSRVDIEAMMEAGVTCFPIAARSNHDPAIIHQFDRAVRTFRPHIVQTFLDQMDLIAGVALMGRAKWILSERTSPVHYRMPKRLGERAKERLRFLLGGRADMVVANSPAGADVWQSANRTRTIPNALVLPRRKGAAPGVSESEPTRSDFQVLSVSRLVDTKRIEVLIRAVDILRTRGRNLRLDILGDGPAGPALSALVDGLGLTDTVVLHGHCNEPARWLESADVFASASLYEGQPNAVVEAAAFCVPLVLSDIREHRDTVADGALYASCENPDAFAQAIARIMDDRPTAEERLTIAYDLVADRSPDLIASLYIDAYRELLPSSARA